MSFWAPTVVTKPSDFVSKHLKELYSATIARPHFPVSLRSSSLPFCPMQRILAPKVASNDLTMDFYVSVGTAVHDVLQERMCYLPPTCEVHTQWKCDNCGHIHTAIQHKPSFCEQCGSLSLVYNEIEFKLTASSLFSNSELNDMHERFGTPLVESVAVTGHCDALWFNSTGRTYHILDFKTTSIDKINNPYGMPDPKYLVQVRSYAFMLYKQYGIRASTCSISYFGRDRITDKDGAPKFFNFEEPVTEEMLAAQEKDIKRALYNLILLKSFALTGSKKDLRDMVNNRPCVNNATYASRMSPAFFGNTQCPFMNSCTGADKALLPAKKLWKAKDQLKSIIEGKALYDEDKSIRSIESDNGGKGTKTKKGKYGLKHATSTKRVRTAAHTPRSGRKNI